MSDDLISRQAAIDTYLETVSSLCVDEGDGMLTACARDRDILEMLENLPSVQPKTGRWIFEKGDGKTCVDGYICSACGESFHTKVPYWSEFKFCPCCGARMEETE